MKNKTLWIVLAVVAVLVLWGVSAYNKMVKSEENVGQAFSNIETACQRRMELIPNLVNTVKGAANFERGTLTDVIEARSKASSIQIDANNLTEESISNFMKAQDELSKAINRTISLTVERYPELTATQNFSDLQRQIEGAENRIATERVHYAAAVKQYNSLIRSFPNNIFAGLFGFDKKPYIEAPEGANRAPEVDFSEM
ncbi:MAG: LemA family protein [Bacteroidales bacterium]|nr:LemA family protein [Bacteroidales bacterium]